MLRSHSNDIIFIALITVNANHFKLKWWCTLYITNDIYFFHAATSHSVTRFPITLSQIKSVYSSLYYSWRHGSMVDIVSVIWRWQRTGHISNWWNELFIMYFEMHDSESASFYSLKYWYTLMLDVYILNLFHEFYHLSKWKFCGRFLFK